MPTHTESTPFAAEKSGELAHLVLKGKAALENGNLESALDCFEHVVSHFPDNPEGHNNLGSLYATLGHHEKAEKCFTHLLSIMPDNCNIHYNRGIVRIRLRRWDEAIDDFNSVLATYPDDADCWNNLGVAAYLKGDFPKAISHFFHSLDLTPNFPNAVLNLCDAEVAAGNTTDALDVCRKYLREYSNLEVHKKELELCGNEVRRLLKQTCSLAEAVDLRSPGCTDIIEEQRRLLAARSVLSDTSLSVAAASC